MQNTIFMDTETTGLNGNDVALEIGICDADCNILFNRRIKPRFRRKWHGAQGIHGISPSDVKDCPSYIEIEPELINIMQGRDIVMYNPDFDIEKLARSARCYKYSKVNWLEVNARSCMGLASSKWFYCANYYGNVSLANAADCAGVKNERSHSAIHDAMTTARVYKYLLDNPLTEKELLAYEKYSSEYEKSFY